jgi:hypothetical protein
MIGEAEAHLNVIQEFSPYLEENTTLHTITNINLVILFKETVAVFGENNKNPTRSKCGIADC